MGILDILVKGTPVVNLPDAKVSALTGAAKQDLPGPWNQANYTENLKDTDSLSSFIDSLGLDGNVIDYDLTAVWDCNCQYISDFHVNVSGHADPFASLSVSAKTYDPSYDDNGMAQMKYDIICTIADPTQGSKTVFISAQASGDGSGMSLGKS
jgi:hypothetical protein